MLLLLISKAANPWIITSILHLTLLKKRFVNCLCRSYVPAPPHRYICVLLFKLLRWYVLSDVGYKVVLIIKKAVGKQTATLQFTLPWVQIVNISWQSPVHSIVEHTYVFVVQCSLQPPNRSILILELLSLKEANT